MGNVTTGSKYSSTTKYTTTPNGKTFKVEVGEGGINKVSKSNNMGSFLTALGAKGVDLGAQIAGGYISDMFNQSSEERADKRNRALIRDTAQLQVEGRRKAGLNPYTLEGSQLPGMSAQSSTDTSSNSNFMNDLMMRERLELDRALAESQIAKNNADANKANADANRVTGQETRDVESWNVKLEQLIASLQDTKLKNRMQEIELEISDYTKENRKFQSDLDVQEGLYAIEQQIANIAFTNVSTAEKQQNIANLIEQQKCLQLQQALSKAGISKTYAETQEIFANIKLMGSQKNMTDQQAGYYKELAFLTDAQKENQLIQNVVDEKYAGKRAKMQITTGYIDSIGNGLKTVSSEALKWVGTIATGGLSAGVSSFVASSSSDFY